MNPNDELTPVPSREDGLHAIRNIADSYIEAARIITARLDVAPEDRQWYIEQGIPASLLRNLERLGRGEINEKLLLASSRGESQLLKLPLSEQTLAIEKGIEVLEDDETNTRMIAPASLTPAQCKQVFAPGGGIRDLGEQRSYIQERKRKEVRPANPATDIIIKRGFCIIRGHSLTMEQLAVIMSQMAAK